MNVTTVLVVIGVGVVSALLSYWLTRKYGNKTIATSHVIDESVAKRLQDELAAEKLARTKQDAAINLMRSKQEAIKRWLDTSKKEIDREAQDRFKRLVGDPDKLDELVAKLLEGTEKPESREG